VNESFLWYGHPAPPPYDGEALASDTEQRGLSSSPASAIVGVSTISEILNTYGSGVEVFRRFTNGTARTWRSRPAPTQASGRFIEHLAELGHASGNPA